ncbi:hypothetical protein G0U75_03480, partial [Staphylococcus aureus]|nr:hypothetical protein [Staphylococcus aureus]
CNRVPIVNVPSGLADCGIPAGVQVIGHPFDDRSAFEVAAADQGARTTFLEPSSTQIGHKGSVRDTARVLGRMFDAIEYRGASQDTVEQLAAWSGVPVYNGLTDAWHPTQMLADALTMT